MNHYYQNNSELKSDIHTVEYTMNGNKVSLYADNGVFSKDRVDFGTNVMLNTLALKNNLKEININGGKVLDVGCGYGVIGISIAKSFNNLKVTMVDCNDRAIELCNKSIIKNKVSNANVIYSDLYSNVQENFDCIISNPPIRAGKEVVHGVAMKGYEKLNLNGTMWIVIQKKQGAASMQEQMLQVFGNCDAVNKEKGYYILMSKKVK